MSPIVRPVRPEDAAQWVALRCALWPDHGDDIPHDAEDFLAGSCRWLRAVLVAEEDGRLIGFAELGIRAYAQDCETDRVAFLEGWYVAPAARRRGVGRALVAAAEEWGRAQGCTEFASDTEAENTLSAAAHEALGFSDAGLLRCFRKSL